MYCLGCGSDIANKPEDRRDIKANGKISAVWKAFLDKESEDHDSISVDNILSGRDSQRAPKMCRKCFYAYDKYIKLQDTILENIRKASDVLELDLDVQPGPSKRHALDSSRTTRHSAITGLSPEVAVGSLIFLLCIRILIA